MQTFIKILATNMENYSKKVITEHGTVYYYNSKGQYHRTDGPAAEWADGSKFWYKNGLWHRLAGPAIEYIIGHKDWCIKNYSYSKSCHNRLYLFSVLEPRIIDINPTEK